MEKMCSKCKLVKPFAGFYPKPRRELYGETSAGYSSQCRECLKAKQIDWRKQNPDKAKDVDLSQRFGISLDMYNQLFEAQGGACAICRVHQSRLEKALAVDHCHRTGDIRGLLCNNCNRALGLLKDNIQILLEAAEYLKPMKEYNSEVAEQNTTVVDLSTKKGG